MRGATQRALRQARVSFKLVMRDITQTGEVEPLEAGLEIRLIEAELLGLV